MCAWLVLVPVGGVKVFLEPGSTSTVVCHD